MLQVCLNFLHDVEQIKNELPTMRQEMRNLRTELQEHRVNFSTSSRGNKLQDRISWVFECYGKF